MADESQRKNESSRQQRVERSDDEWRELLSEQEYDICRNKGTERAFTGRFWDCKEPGIYVCRGCGEALFDSDTKYDSGSGWPSFYRPTDADRVSEHVDDSLGMRRVEVTCARCGSHLGHVFPDGPAPTGMRYCINSASLDLEPKNED